LVSDGVKSKLDEIATKLISISADESLSGDTRREALRVLGEVDCEIGRQYLIDQVARKYPVGSVDNASQLRTLQYACYTRLARQDWNTARQIMNSVKVAKTDVEMEFLSFAFGAIMGKGAAIALLDESIKSSRGNDTWRSNLTVMKTIIMTN
jgi:hypothetical protein